MHLLLSNFPAFRTVCKCAGHCYSLWVCRTLLWTWDVMEGLGHSSITKGHAQQEQKRLESAGTNWNWLEPAGYSSYASRLVVSGLLTSLWDSTWTLTFPQLGQFLVSLHTGTALVNSHLPTGTAFWLSHLPIGTTLGVVTSSALYRDVSLTALQSCSVNQTKQWAYFVSNTDTEP